ncbi:ATP-binding protein [Polyangium sorediatum]|uniref:ATP-binding protein n=1 Tax=Polyangium sorediatum TaxID=889274 RepID=A0ABT6NPI8_9BACT|nr:ATP-binding protein [Polyangium sorediatum]MDI1430198.1 ATP-binding protein [Polyangium sorediatum]
MKIMTEHDALLEVFLSSTRKDLFHSVEHRTQIWREDPFDVECVHEKAREQFQKLLAQATGPQGLDSGRILLLLGESGSGKTHLVRAFRNHVHVHGLGFVGYMQMTTAITSYSRYLVSNLIDSLDQAYYESTGTTSGLLRLSTAIATRCGDVDAIRALCEAPTLSMQEIVDLVERAADRLIAHPRYADLDLDLVRALLFLQRQDPALKKRVIKYLRCEALSERDRKYLGDISPRVGEEDAQRLVEQLGRLIAAFDNRSLVLCVDQFEDTGYVADDAEAQFRRVMTSLCAVADQVPSSIIVITCLGDYYRVVKPRLTRSTLDRLERDPPPVELFAPRSAEEVEKIIAHRLGHLYEVSGVKPRAGTVDPIYPFPRAIVQRLEGLRVRDVLDECQRFREACIDAGRLVEFAGIPVPVVSPPPPDGGRIEKAEKIEKERLERDWNDFLVQYREDGPEVEAEIARLFAWAVGACAEELGGKYRFEVAVKGETIDIKVLVPKPNGVPRVVEELLVAVCNRNPHGNGLRTQALAARKQAGKRTLGLLRTVEFPKNRTTQIWKLLDEITRSGGRKGVLEESDLRKIAAFQWFRDEHRERPHFQAWVRDGRLLARIPAIDHLLALDNLQRFDVR